MKLSAKRRRSACNGLALAIAVRPLHCLGFGCPGQIFKLSWGFRPEDLKQIDFSQLARYGLRPHLR